VSLQAKDSFFQKSPPVRTIYIRVFKKEMRLELWQKHENEQHFRLFRKYEICGKSGNLGPKRKEGDLQIPEGFYLITAVDPHNRFYKGLRLNYPNESDQILADTQNPGSDIFIHGSCLSTGCIAMSNEVMDELYALVEAVMLEGQITVPVHIFPNDFSQTSLDKLSEQKVKYKDHLQMWKIFEEAQQHFEEWRSLPWIKVNEKGNYYIIK
jgi:murein L,D-transpeptidase YafK